MFPAASEQRKLEDEVTKNYKFDIFCTLSDAGDPEEDGKCGECGEWFHHDCENIPKTEKARMVLLFLLLNNYFKIMFPHQFMLWYYNNTV